MKVAITGSSGLVGSALIPALQSEGHTVVRIVRNQPQSPQEVRWNPVEGTIDKNALDGVDVVVNLAGESIAEGRWTAEKKARIRDSRIKGTRLISETSASLAQSPRVIISSSAIGYYGDRSDETLREDSSMGTGFLSDVCKEWETATEATSAKGIRVVHLRTGIVLSPNGGALAKMLLPFKMSVGGKLGPGDQYMSWVDIDDMVGIIQFALTNESLQGAVNCVSPNPVSNAKFTKALGKVLKRPTLIPVPSLVARAAFGEMADALLLASTRVEPAKLIEAGYSFRYPELEGSLYHLLG